MKNQTAAALPILAATLLLAAPAAFGSSLPAPPTLAVIGGGGPFGSLAATAARPGPPGAADPLITLNNPVVAAPGAPASGGLPPASSNALTTTDQENLVGSVTADSGISSGTTFYGVGQSFTPTQAVINAATFPLANNANSMSVTVELQVYAGDGFGGALLVTGTPVTFSGSSTPQTVELTLPTPLTLAPGSVYTLRVLATSGSYAYGYSTSNPYSGGIAYSSRGGAASSNDLVFSEGFDTALVPEPTTSLGGALLGGLALAGVRRRVRRA